MKINEIKTIDGIVVGERFCTNNYKVEEKDGTVRLEPCLHEKEHHKGKVEATDECYIDPATGKPVLKAEVIPHAGECKLCDCTRFNGGGYIVRQGSKNVYIRDNWIYECAKCGKYFSRIPPTDVIGNGRHYWKPPDKYWQLFCDECYDEGVAEETLLYERAQEILSELTDISSKILIVQKWRGGFTRGIENEDCYRIDDDGVYAEITVGECLDGLDTAFKQD